MSADLFEVTLFRIWHGQTAVVIGGAGVLGGGIVPGARSVPAHESSWPI